MGASYSVFKLCGYSTRTSIKWSKKPGVWGQASMRLSLGLPIVLGNGMLKFLEMFLLRKEEY